MAAKKKTARRQINQSISDMGDESTPKTKIITRKYLYAVAAVLVVIGLLFAASRYWVIAWVDNKPVTKFELYSMLVKNDAGKTTEDLIIQKLLESESSRRKVIIGKAEIESEVKKVETQQQGAEKLDELLKANGMTRDDFMDRVKRQLLMGKMFGEGVNITEEDVNKYLEENKQQLPPEVLSRPEGSEAAKLKEGVKEQLKWTKVSENYKAWLDENLKSSRVVRN